MTEPTEGTTDLFDQLKTLADALSVDQKKLLAAIVKVARDITEVHPVPSGQAFHDDFEDAFVPFAPKTVALVLEYADSPPQPLPPFRDMITRRQGHLMIPVSPTSDTTAQAMIVRTSLFGHADDDDND